MIGLSLVTSVFTAGLLGYENTDVISRDLINLCIDLILGGVGATGGGFILNKVKNSVINNARAIKNGNIVSDDPTLQIKNTTINTIEFPDEDDPNDSDFSDELEN